MATYTHIYNAAGGSINGGATWQTTYTRGNPAYLTPTPSRSGYTFLYWTVTASGTGAEMGVNYAPNINIAIQSNVTLTAQWWQNHTIKFNPNGGYFENRNWSYILEKGTAVVYLREAPVRAGYNFLGWRDGKYNQALWSAGQAFGADVNTEMKAEWSRNSTNTSSLVYNINGGTGDSSPQTKNVGQAITLHSAPTRTGYTFSHWEGYQDLNSDGQADIFAAGAVYNYDAWDRLTATWKNNDTGKVYWLGYHTLGGFPANWGEQKSSDTFQVTNKTPSKTNCTFLGWGNHYIPYLRDSANENLADSRYFQFGKNLAGTNAVLTDADTKYCTSEFITVSANTSYTFAFAADLQVGEYVELGWYWFDSNKTVIGAGNWVYWPNNAAEKAFTEYTKTVGSPVGAAYLRFFTTQMRHGFTKLEKGSTFTGYKLSAADTQVYSWYKAYDAYTNTAHDDINFYAGWLENENNVYIKMDGAWKAGSTFAKINGAWKHTCIFTKINGVWKEDKI